MSTRLLALDCATETLHLALLVDGRVLARALPGGAQASATLLPALQALLAEGGTSLRALDALAFGRGPGAFTGLRTACAVVQGLAMGAGRPLIALDTLAAVAESAFRAGAPDRLWTVLDARMGEFYAAAWRRGADERERPATWTAERPPALLRPDALAALARAADAPPAWAGIGLAALPPGTLAALPAWPLATPDGAALVHLARAALARGELLDAALGLPLYVRDKVALTTAERAAGSAPA